MEASITLTAMLKAFAALVALASKAHKADAVKGVGQEEVDALEAALKAFSETWSLLPEAEKPSPPLDGPARVMLLAAFLVAWRQVRATVSVTQPRRWSVWADERALQTELDARVRVATKKTEDPDLLVVKADQVAALAELQHSPLARRAYRELWDAFASPRPTVGEDEDRPALLDVGDRLPFERFLLVAWWKLRLSDAGKVVATTEEAAGMLRQRLVRELRVADMADWGRRHVFGNIAREAMKDDLTVPFMALDDIYVEPDAALAGTKEAPRPAIDRVRALLAEGAGVIVVIAPFGHGKSLTARRIAQQHASAFLRDATASPDNRMPVFVRCAETHEGSDVARSVRRALMVHAEAIDPSLKFDADDEANAMPEGEQSTLFLLDGLDEVSWSGSELKGLFAMLRDKSTARHRFVVFSRPGVIPLRDDLCGARIIELKALRTSDAEGDSQAEIWLERWNALREPWLVQRRDAKLEALSIAPLTTDDLQEAGLLGLASTPILLFLAAHGHAIAGTFRGTQAALYEDFFWHIARGKYAHDGEKHPALHRAAEELTRVLRRRGLLDPSAAEPMAMLWLLSRVAWESSRREWQDRVSRIRDGSDEVADADVLAMRRHHVAHLLENDLGVTDRRVAQSIEVGVLVALQAELQDDDHVIHYGHRSFREFLVARYWADRLRAGSSASGEGRDGILAALAGGKLLNLSDRTFAFLVEFIEEGSPPRPGSPLGWTRKQREDLEQLAIEGFMREDPIMEKRPGEPYRFCDDRRPLLRSALLAIANTLKSVSLGGSLGSLRLRSLLAYHSTLGVVTAMRLHGANLSGATLTCVDLSGADLSDADLSNANLSGADLSGADLSRADLSGSYFPRVDFSATVLTGANFRGADLSDAIFRGADLRAADLRGAEIADTAFTTALLTGVVLSNAFLVGANLTDADLAGVDLAGAFLMNANLAGADLAGADLAGANLAGANLTNARLDGAQLKAATFSLETVWPKGFDPADSGATLAKIVKNEIEIQGSDDIPF